MPLPERIEAAGVMAETTKIGKYSVKVYSDISLTNLIRTITSEADAWAATISWENWNGKDDAGSFAADGTYYLVVDVKDYADNPAENNLLTRSVVVDNSIPVVSNLSVAPYYFAPGATNSNIKTTILTYEVNDNSSKAKVTIDVYQGTTFVKTLLSDSSWRSDGTYDQLWDGSGQTGYVGTVNGIVELPDGTYTFKVSAIDEAGNSAEVKVMDVVVDTEGPVGSIVVNNSNPPGPTYTISKSVDLYWSASDGISGVDKICFNNESAASNWALYSNPASSWQLTDGDGPKLVYLRAMDNAGNYQDFNDTIILDTVDPNFSAGPSIDPAHTPVNSWSQHTSPYLAFMGADATSGVDYFECYVDGGLNQTVDYTGPMSYNWHPNLSDGTHLLKIRIYDNAGRYFDSPDYTFKVDTTAPGAPSVTVSHTLVNTWSNHNSPYFTWPNPGDGNGSGVSYYRGYIDSVDQGNVSSSWHPTLSDGTHNVYIKAVDGVALSNNSQTFTFKIDTVAPVISDFSGGTFNPYVDDNITINFTASDAVPSSGFSTSNITAKIKYGANTVKDLTVYDDSGGSYHVTWDGTNNNVDYENEGNYTLEITALDGAGNPASAKTSTITLQDDQCISYPGQGYEPRIFIDGNMYLRWIHGWDDSQVLYCEAKGRGSGNHWAEATFYIDHSQSIYVDCWADDNVTTDHYVYDPDGIEIFHSKSRNGDGYVQANKIGTYTVKINWDTWYNNAAGTKVTYYDRKFNQYEKISLNLGQTWPSQATGPAKVDSYSTGPTTQPNYLPVINTNPDFRPYPIGSITHNVRASSGIYYKRGAITGYNITNIVIGYWIAPVISWGDEVEIAIVGDQPAIVSDAQGNAYVAWHVQVDFNSQINFQKVPYNFARITGTFQGSSIVGEEKPASSQQATLESPTLVAPEDEAEVNTLRPTFKWQHHKGDTQEYKLDLDKYDTFDSVYHQTFTKDENTGSPDKPGGDPNLYFYTYSIDEFEPGLDQDTYYWRVTALTTNEAATSEVWSFTVAPQLTLTGVINYPNPFNPNREATKIRYRLGADADDVKIRIYDIAGSLVVNIPNCPTDGERSSVWEKYNDVDWDGRNGRGDVVMNGIYPFEVTARLGGRSISVRGKIAVLK